ncbi:MAG: zf-HC2 domain-containing protein [Abditibacteriota bacterium]|nr:zf-HC2 domain-containing protein [Abditibacteriota bacterium]
MNCEYVEKQIVKFIDGEISQSEFDSVREHIDSCASCKKFQKDIVFADNYMSQIITPKSHKTFDDLEKLINVKRYVSYIPTWAVVASILFAAALGTTIGLSNKIDFTDHSYNQYTYNDMTYVSMLNEFN